jgi:hypothetical protein
MRKYIVALIGLFGAGIAWAVIIPLIIHFSGTVPKPVLPRIAAKASIPVQTDSVYQLLTWNIAYEEGFDETVVWDWQRQPWWNASTQDPELLQAHQQGLASWLATQTANTILLQRDFRLDRKFLPEKHTVHFNYLEGKKLLVPVFQPWKWVGKRPGLLSSASAFAVDTVVAWTSDDFLAPSARMLAVGTRVGPSRLFWQVQVDFAHTPKEPELKALAQQLQRLEQGGHAVVVAGHWAMQPAFAQAKSIPHATMDEHLPKMPPAWPTEDWQVFYDPVHPSGRAGYTPYVSGKTPVQLSCFFLCNRYITVKTVETVEQQFAHAPFQPVRLTYKIENNQNR